MRSVLYAEQVEWFRQIGRARRNRRDWVWSHEMRVTGSERLGRGGLAGRLETWSRWQGVVFGG